MTGVSISGQAQIDFMVPSHEKGQQNRLNQLSQSACIMHQNVSERQHQTTTLPQLPEAGSRFNFTGQRPAKWEQALGRDREWHSWASYERLIWFVHQLADRVRSGCKSVGFKEFSARDTSTKVKQGTNDVPCSGYHTPSQMTLTKGIRDR